jgi:hypothetical protein
MDIIFNKYRFLPKKMTLLSLGSIRVLLFICVVLGVLSTVFQVLSLLTWDDAEPEFVDIIHSSAVHISYTGVTGLTVIFNIIAIIALKGIESVYYVDNVATDLNF